MSEAGYNTIGASETGDFNNNIQAGCQFDMPEPGTATKIVFRVYCYGTDQACSAAIYEDSSDSISAKVGQSSPGVMTTSYQWVEMDSSIHVDAGINWLLFSGNDTYKLAIDATTGNFLAYIDEAGNIYNDFPNPSYTPAEYFSGYVISAYIIYTPDSAQDTSKMLMLF